MRPPRVIATARHDRTANVLRSAAGLYTVTCSAKPEKPRRLMKLLGIELQKMSLPGWLLFQWPETRLNERSIQSSCGQYLAYRYHSHQVDSHLQFRLFLKPAPRLQPHLFYTSTVLNTYWTSPHPIIKFQTSVSSREFRKAKKIFALRMKPRPKLSLNVLKLSILLSSKTFWFMAPRPEIVVLLQYCPMVSKWRANCYISVMILD